MAKNGNESLAAIEGLVVEQWPIGRLVGYPGNPRKNDDAVDRMCAAITEFGFRIPIVAKSDGLIVDGHLRYKAALKLGRKTVPVALADDLTDDQIRAFRLLANQSAHWAEWDMPLLNIELKALEGAGYPLELTGFDKLELVQFMAGGPPEGDPEATPEPPVNPVSRKGDLWLLGKHRLMCGDATSKTDVERVMGGEKADAIVTDPPWGISVVKKKMVGANFGVAKKGKYEPVIGDDTIPEIGFLLQIAPMAIIWGGNYFANQLPPSGSWLVWDKRGNSGIENTFADCEFAWSNIGGPARIHRQLWNGMIREGEHDKRQHPTQKPVALMEWCLQKTTGIIFDPYLGSGSTLIAAERLGRKCVAIELHGSYVDGGVRRWQDYTKHEATLDATGQTFAEVAAERLKPKRAAKRAGKRKAKSSKPNTARGRSPPAPTTEPTRGPDSPAPRAGEQT